MKWVAAYAAGSLLLIGGIVTSIPVAVVDVKESDGSDITVPVPLPLARAALAFAPEEARRVQVTGLARYLPHAGRLVEELQTAPEGVFVEVVEGDEYVRILTEDRVLRIVVIDGDTFADVRVPVRSLEAALRAYDPEDGSFRTSDLVAALGHAPPGRIVHVLDGGQEVEVRMLW